MSLEVKVKKPDVGRGHVLLGTLAILHYMENSELRVFHIRKALRSDAVLQGFYL